MLHVIISWIPLGGGKSWILLANLVSPETDHQIHSECFLWTVGIFPEPHHSNCRIELTKTICILLVMDDIFDTYGSLDELILFTEAIKRCSSRTSSYIKLKYQINFD